MIKNILNETVKQLIKTHILAEWQSSVGGAEINVTHTFCGFGEAGGTYYEEMKSIHNLIINI